MRKTILNIFLWWCWLYWIICSYYQSDANYTVLDQKIEKFCKLHQEANNKNFWVENYKRCISIWQAQIRFETINCKSYVWNNCFNFRSPWIKKEWQEKFWVNNIRWWFLVFPDKTNSIKFWVNRYYIYDQKKTIRQIVEDFTFTKEHRNNYTLFVKEYYYETNKRPTY